MKKTIKQNFLARVATLLLLSLLTTASAWADNVTLSVDGDIAEGTAGHYYVNMPATGTNTLTLTDASITTFKVYDDGGKSGNYSSSSGDTYLVINAPGGYYLQVTGDVIDCSTCYFNIWEGSNIEASDRLLASGNWAQNASVSVTSGSRSIFFAFNSENAEGKQGFDITVTLVDAPEHDIAFSSVANGSATATIGGAVVTTAREGETVAVTATPADGYLLADVSVTCGDEDVAVTISPWTNSATFTMPTGDVSVTPTFAASDGFFITMPVTGTKRLSPVGVTSFKVYDDGGPNGNYSPNCNGWLEIVLPDGYHISFSGSVTTDATTGDRLGFYVGNSTNPQEWPKSETAGVPFNFTYNFDESMRLQFKSNSENEYAGLDLTVTLIGGEHNVTVVNADNVGGSVVTANSTTAGYGQTVTLTASPAEGYVLGTLSVRDADGKVVDVTDMLWYTGTNTATFTMPNSDVTVTPVFTNVMTADGGLTVNMHKKSTPKSVTIPSGVTSFKVYDYGGADCNYSDNYSGKLNLTAPEGCVLQLSGTITAQSGSDYLTVVDGTLQNVIDYLLDHVSSTADGVATAIPTVVSTGNNLTLTFYSDDADNYAGLDLTVTVISPGTDYSVTVSNADTSKGTMTADVATAQLGTTVTLTATPADGYVLSDLSVTCGGRAVKTSWNVWTNSATFKMPNGNVTVTPTFTNDLTKTSLAVCLPVKGNKYVTIPEGVASFKIYDDGGPTGNYTPYCIGGVDLTAPEGCLLRFTGSVAGPEYKFFLSIAGNDIATATTNDIDVTSTNNNPRINLATSYSDTGAGLDLTATVLYAVGVATGITNGSVTINGDKTHAAADETVTLTVTPDADCTVFSVSVNGQPLVAVGGVYSFTMPAKNVTVTATFYPNVILDFAEGQTWATYYHEDGLTYSVSEGAQAYYVSSIGESTVNLTAIDGVPSGLPVLISGSGTVTLTATASAEVDVTDNDARFKGTPTALSATDFTDFADRRTYVLYGGKFLLVEQNSGIGAHKCWLTLSGSNARQLNISIGDATTSLSPGPFPERKGSWYTLDGRKLGSEPTCKGVYIYKGKKVIIK